MRTAQYVLFVAVFALGVPFSVDAQEPKPSFFFIRDLKVGMVGEDVRELQKLLNRDPETRIPGTGIGSSGQESAYFGEITRSAVIKFQNKYQNEVLRPVGLSVGTGNVGLWTRMKLNQILINAEIVRIPAKDDSVAKNNDISDTDSDISNKSTKELKDAMQSVSQGLFGSDSAIISKELAISSLSKYTGRAGSTIVLSGSGFSTDKNTIKLGSNKYENQPSRSKGEISFMIPSTVKPGRYDVSVSVSGKTSNTVPFMVTVPDAVPPVIIKIEPVQAKFGQSIKVFGENFTPKGNIVSTNVGIFHNIPSSDGSSLTFSIPLPDYEFIEEITDAIKWPVKVRVVNENGMSTTNAASSFTITN